MGHSIYLVKERILTGFEIFVEGIEGLRTCLKSQLKALTHKALNEIKPLRSKSSLGKDSKILFKQVLMR